MRVGTPAVSALAIAKLLWRDEALQFLEVIGAADGLKSKPRRIIYNRLVDVVDLASLQGRVRDQLRSRQDWRPAGRPQAFLAKNGPRNEGDHQRRYLY